MGTVSNINVFKNDPSPTVGEGLSTLRDNQTAFREMVGALPPVTVTSLGDNYSLPVTSASIILDVPNNSQVRLISIRGNLSGEVGAEDSEFHNGMIIKLWGVSGKTVTLKHKGDNSVASYNIRSIDNADIVLSPTIPTVLTYDSDNNIWIERERTSTILSDTTGDLSNLTTTNKTNLVAAINEVKGNTSTNATNISNLSSKVGTGTINNKVTNTNVVAAINDLITKIGLPLSSLTTSVKTSLITAINSLVSGKADKADVGTLSNLTTTEKGSIVGAINEVVSNLGTSVGDLTTLSTTNKSSVVSAINEIYGTSGVVHKSGDETITGKKSFVGSVPVMIFKHTSLVKGTAPTNHAVIALDFRDSTSNSNNNIGVFHSAVSPAGNTCVRMRAYKPEAGSTEYVDIELYYLANGTTYATAPTPSLDDAGTTKIATTAWVRTATGGFACNAATATQLKTARSINISDEDGTNTGTAISFNGSANGTIKLPSTIKATLTGNASTATKFYSNRSVTLTGDVTGSANSKAGWTVATTLSNSGVTAGDYGPSANASPSHGSSFSVPYITVDAKGRVTAASTKTITLPADNNTDTKVNQNVSTQNKTYPILIVPTENATANLGAKETYFAAGVKINPSTNVISASGFSGNLTGNVTGNVTGNADTATKATQDEDGNAIKTTYAKLASPIFTGTPKAPTAAAGTSTTQLATTAFVRTEISNLVGTAPTTLDTIQELATALGGDANFATTVATQIGTKANNTDVVHNTGDEDITGTKSFKSGTTPIVKIQHSGFTKGTTLSTDKYAQLVLADSSNNSYELGVLRNQILANSGTSRTSIRAYKNVANSTDFAAIDISCTTSGETYARAPSTLTTRTDGTDIVTRDFIPVDTRIVHTTDNETIAGVKTFTSDIYIRDSSPSIVIKTDSYSKGDSISSTKTQNINWYDTSSTTSNSTRFGGISLALNKTTTDTSNNITAQDTVISLFAFRNAAGGTDYAGIRLYYPYVGSPYATAPSTPSNGTSTDIITRDYLDTHKVEKTVWSSSNLLHITLAEAITATSSSPYTLTSSDFGDGYKELMIKLYHETAQPTAATIRYKITFSNNRAITGQTSEGISTSAKNYVTIKAVNDNGLLYTESCRSAGAPSLGTWNSLNGVGGTSNVYMPNFGTYDVTITQIDIWSITPTVTTLPVDFQIYVWGRK